MVNAACHLFRSARRGLAPLAACIAVLIAANARADDAAAVSPADEPPQREIFIPFDDLHVILSSDVQRVFVTREEYEALAAKAKRAFRPDEPEQPAAVLSADYVATIEENHARLVGTLVVRVPNRVLSAVELDLSGVALRTATLDDKPAALGRNPAGLPVLFVSGAGPHELKLEILAPLDTAAAQRTLSFQIPTPPATRIKLTVPGNVEIKSGATVIRRDVDQQPATTFDLLPRRGQNSLVLSLNNHQLRKESVVVAHSVLIDEITTAYERLYVTESMSVLHGAADQFHFALPDGFEVTSVNCPQVARWAITTESGKRILEVRLREPITDAASLNIAAIRTPAALSEWRLPKLAAIDVAGEAAVVGLLLENRLKPYDLQPKNLIPIDASVLAQTLPASSLESQAGAPALTPVAAFYAPRGDYDLKARFAPPPTELRVTTNVLLTLTESKLEARGGFALLNATDKLLGFDFSAPAGWQVMELSLDGGAALPLETYPAEDGGTRIHVRLPQATPLGRSCNVFFRAVSTPNGWLDDWHDKQVEFPVFQVASATRDGGAIAVQSQDDMLARADKVTRLTPLDANEKSKYGLDNVTTELAYRYDAPPYALSLAVSRVEPRLTARAFSFFRVEPDLLTAHYEIAYDVTEARTNRLSFALPESTPAELAIRGLDGLTIKESSSAVKDKERQWTVLLGESRRGAIRLAIDFQQPLGVASGSDREKKAPDKADKATDKPAPAPADLTLPLVRALHVAYQTGMVAVEGSSDTDVQVKTELRKVDVGLLAAADYQPGRRLLGAFGYGGDEAEVKVAIARPPGYDLPTAIVERAELLTMVSASGQSQTAARFQLRSKAQLIEVRLPKGSTLWSAYLDGKPTLPQLESSSLLIELPAAPEELRRNLQLVYETPVNTLSMASSLNLAAPKLLLRAKRKAEGEEVPLADLVWQLSTPDGFKVVRSDGTVFSGNIAMRESPLSRVAETVSGVFAPIQSAREAAYRRLAPADSSTSLEGETKSADMPSGQMVPRYEQTPQDIAVHEKYAKAPILHDSNAMTGLAPDSAADKQAGLGPAPQEPGYQLSDGDDGRQANVTKPVQIENSPGRRKSGETEQSQWALEGVRSLPIDFQPDQDQIQTTFQSLGEEPSLSVTVVDRERFNLLGWCVAPLVFFRGVTLTRQPRWRRFRFAAVTLVVSFALPLILPWTGVIGPPCNMAFYAACWLVVYYLAAGIAKRMVRFVHKAFKERGGARPRVAILGLLLLLARTASADEPLVQVKVPSDAIIVPYNPDKEDPLEAMKAQSDKSKPDGDKRQGNAFGTDKSQKLLVPYEKYLALQRAAHPDETVKPAPPAEYALADGHFTTKLEDGESLLFEGRLDVDVLVDHAVSVPLWFAGGVLTKAEVDGKPGTTAALNQSEASNNQTDEKNQAARSQPAETRMALIISGAGRRHVELAMRFRLQRLGGWQIAEGRLPAPPAAAITLQVAKAGTEVNLSGGVDRGNFETNRDNEAVETALAADGAFRLQWRAKAGPAPVDQSLTVTDAAQLDVQEDGLRLVWQFDLEFQHGQRDSFTVDVPNGYLVEKVTGSNVRGWLLNEAGGARKLEVTLLKAAQDTESFAVALSRRGAVGSGEFAEFAAPVLNVEGAAQQSGELTIRRSPLLELRIEDASGASRADGESPRTNANADSEESPLGILPFQVYRFATTPFTVKLSARPVAPRVSAELQTVLRISEQQRTVESRIRMRVEDRPVYRLRIALPDDLRLDRVSAPEPFQWVVDKQGPRRLLSLYFAAGQRQSFDVVLAGPLGEYGAAETVATPKLEVVDTDEQGSSIEQTGDIAVEVDPSLDIRSEKLVHCEAEPVERVNAWLNPAQQRLARLALRYRTPDYAAQLQLSPRKPIVHCDTYSNIRVNERTVEETILLDFTIREAGIRSLSFVLPESMRAARISAPMLRQKTVEPVGAGTASQVRVRIELQEEVMGSLRVLVENDRLLTAEKYAAPIPAVETGQTDHRYITLESAGCDEIVVDAREGIDPVGQEQAEWRMLTALLGRGLTQAYLVRPGAAQPLLTLHAQDRAAVETASARIGLAKAMLVVDANGAYRGAQMYRVDNSLEQFLEIQLPAGARLWTAHVAGEPVKPAAGKAAGTAGDVVRIPLVKTAHGDSDYAVMLKYGGQLGRLSTIDHVDFPLIHTLNIHVELSQVELYVPKNYDWSNFGGTMRLVQSEGDLAAGWLAYNTRQIDLAMQAWHSEDPYAKARATQNLKALQAESESLKQTAEEYRSNTDVQQQLKLNSSVQSELEVENAKPADQKKLADDIDNRSRLGTLYKSQFNARANEVVNSAGQNFEQPVAQAPPQAANPQQGFSKSWLAKNKLANEPTAQPPAKVRGPAGQPSAQFKPTTTASPFDLQGEQVKSDPFSDETSRQPAAPPMTYGGFVDVGKESLTARPPAAPAPTFNGPASGNNLSLTVNGSGGVLKLPQSNATQTYSGAKTLNSGNSSQFDSQESSGAKADLQLQRYSQRLAQQQDQNEPQTPFQTGGGLGGDIGVESGGGRYAGSGTLAGGTFGMAGNNTFAGGTTSSGKFTVGGGTTTVTAGTLGGSGSVPGNGAVNAPAIVGNSTFDGNTITETTTSGGTVTHRDVALNSGDFTEHGGGIEMNGAPVQAAKPAAPAVLASLEVELHPRGVKYLFTTPRGEAEITAQAVSGSLVGRLIRLAGLAVALLVLFLAMRRWRAAPPIPRPGGA